TCPAMVVKRVVGPLATVERRSNGGRTAVGDANSRRTVAAPTVGAGGEAMERLFGPTQRRATGPSEISGMLGRCAARRGGRPRPLGSRQRLSLRIRATMADPRAASAP